MLKGTDFDILRHTVGATEKSRKNWGYRNYFCANFNEKDSDYLACSRLTDAGFMEAGAVANGSKSRYFYATEEGLRALGFTQREIRKTLEDK